MALCRRFIVHIVQSQRLRYSTERNESSFWEILPKEWRQQRLPGAKPDALAPHFAPSTKVIRFFNKFNPFTPKQFGAPKRNFEEEHKGFQDCVNEESKSFGHSVSLAQYLTFQGVRVRFSRIPEWISKDENYNLMPAVTEMGNHLTGIDMSHLNVDMVTMKVIREVHSVTFFSAQSCPFFDDYCLDQISANLPGLEELDLSDCPQITAKGLGILPRLKRLRSLNLNGVKSDAELELVCVLLEEHFPELKIEGVTYQDLKIDAN